MNITVIFDFACSDSTSYTFLARRGAVTFVFLGHNEKHVFSPLKIPVGSCNIDLKSFSSKYVSTKPNHLRILFSDTTKLAAVTASAFYKRDLDGDARKYCKMNFSEVLYLKILELILEYQLF